MDENKNSHENEEKEMLWRRFDVITDDKEQLQRAEVLLQVKKIDRYDLALILATFCINPLLSEAHLQSLLRVQKEKGREKNMSITQIFQKAAVS